MSYLASPPHEQNLYDELFLPTPMKAPQHVKKATKSDGSASSYYDFPAGATTLNDVMEDLAANRWHGDALHLKDIFKAAWRWGEKEGTTKAYDARKIIYYGARLLMLYAGVEALRTTLQSLLDDKQFQNKGEAK